MLGLSFYPRFLPAQVAKNQTGAERYFTINKAKYEQQLKGFWLGQNIANWTGLITEMDKVGTPETMPFYTDDDWQTRDLKAIWGEYVPHSNVIDFYIEPELSVWGSDDDTDIEYIYLHLLSQHQVTMLSAKQIQAGWLNHIYSEVDAPLYKKFPDSKPQKENFLWESNQRAYELMQQGLLPPETSLAKNNRKSQMIDAQLTTEVFGLLSPTNVAIAKKISALPISVSASGEAAEIANYYVAMHALASAVDHAKPRAEQIESIALEARHQLSDELYPAKMFDAIWAHYKANPNIDDWESTRDFVYHRYQLTEHDGYHYGDPFEAGINFAASLVSLFYGQGDIKKTIKIGSLVGWDADNPTATWGGLLGFMYGHQGVIDAFNLTSVSEDYWIHRTRRNFPDYTPDRDGEDNFSLMAARMLQIIDRIVLNELNGEVDKNCNCWLIPN
ncbi:ADP-ribosylglycohydrolase family protein [Thalassotalea sp. LPB0316]|nr:ADP-ribosylglycohydrolase family protein [Thalassotalea sp. LPB0316]